MKGTMIDFLKLASENEELGREIRELAAKHDFEFIPPEELSEEELEKVAGGLTMAIYLNPSSGEQDALQAKMDATRQAQEDERDGAWASVSIASASAASSVIKKP